jgi:hypothetical protein
MSNCSAAWGAEVIHQRAGDQLAALVTSYLRGRTGVGGLEEADQHTTGRPRRAVVQHHVELVVEAGTKPLRICSRQYGVGEDPDNPESFPVRRRAAVFAVHSKLLLRVVTEEWHEPEGRPRTNSRDRRPRGYIGPHFRSPNASIEVREFLSMPGMS